MGSIKNSKTLFGFTSPRTVEKIIPEIQLLSEKFGGQPWSVSLQKKFFDELYASEYYDGETYPSDPALAARDRITRAPKAYGFINLKPTINLTDAGKALITSNRKHEVLLRQMLKFQLPSPYHTDSGNTFCVKPFLELLRILWTVKKLSKTEIALYFLQLKNYRKFDQIVKKINNFRQNATIYKGSRKTYVNACFQQEIKSIYREEIRQKKFKTRQSSDTTFKKFCQTKKSNMLDYADALIRHLRSTQLVSFEKNTYRLIISPTKTGDVDFILKSIDPEPSTFATEEAFKKYLFSATNVPLLDDNEKLLIKKLQTFGKKVDAGTKSISELKQLLDTVEKEHLQQKMAETRKVLKTYSEYDDIINVFNQIKKKEVPDPPLFLEWNVWRALTMLNHAIRIDGNFVIDLDGIPLNTAGGRLPDIESEFDTFGLITEVTLSSGHRQYNMEGEPVPRHYGDFKRAVKKEAYCLFIAPRISDGTLAHYFNLNRSHTKYYGGKTKIIPITLDQFLTFVETGKQTNFDDPEKLHLWLETIWKYNQTCVDEEEWKRYIASSIAVWAS